MVSNILLKSCCAENLLWRAITEPAAISEFVWVTTVIGPLLLREKLQYRTFQTCPPPHGLLTSWQTGHSTWDWAVVRLTWWCAVPSPSGDCAMLCGQTPERWMLTSEGRGWLHVLCLPCDRMLMWWSTQTTWASTLTGWTERPTQRCCMSLCSAARCWRFFNRPQLCCI